MTGSVVTEILRVLVLTIQAVSFTVTETAKAPVVMALHVTLGVYGMPHPGGSPLQ